MRTDVKGQMGDCRDLVSIKDVGLLRALQKRLQDTIALAGIFEDQAYIDYCRFRLTIVEKNLERYDI